jgi:hypothetical protein
LKADLKAGRGGKGTVTAGGGARDAEQGREGDQLEVEDDLTSRARMAASERERERERGGGGVGGVVKWAERVERAGSD